MIRLSLVLSIHNRGKLLRRALGQLLSQTLSPKEWEIVLVDDCSTENLVEAYQPVLGKLNIRHVRFDHRRHPLWIERNPGWQPGQREHWYHTPALTTNAGVALAQAKVIGLCHPEILHAPNNFARAVEELARDEKRYLFGRTYLGTQATNRWLDTINWAEYDWGRIMRGGQINRLQSYGVDGLYWYTSFLPKRAVEIVRGVDFVYLSGVAAEDDDFRDRIGKAGYVPTFDAALEGIHLDHSDEPEYHRLRHTPEWRQGLERNRAVYFGRKHNTGFPAPEHVNTAHDWRAPECVVNVEEHYL